MKLSNYKGPIEGTAGDFLLILCDRAKRFVGSMAAHLVRRDLCGDRCAGPMAHRVVKLEPENIVVNFRVREYRD